MRLRLTKFPQAIQATEAERSCRSHNYSLANFVLTCDPLEVNGQDIRQQPIEDRKRRLAGILRLPHEGIVVNVAPSSTSMPARLAARGIVSKTARFSVPCWQVDLLAQD